MRLLSWRSILGALLLLAPRDASAYCRTTTCDPNQTTCNTNDTGCIKDGVPLRWTTMPITYRFSKVGSSKLDANAARAVIRRSFDAWADVQCPNGRTSLRFNEGQDVSGAVPANVKDLTNFGIYYRDDTWPHDDAEESIALTTQTYGKQTGTIDTVVMEINTANNTFALTDDEQGTDLQAVVTHEVGHYIGLAHSPNPDAIMVARYCQQDTTETSSRCSGGSDRKRALADDDVAALCALYPPGATMTSSAAVVAPASGCSAAGPGDASLAGGLVVVAAALIRRRRRQ